MIIKITTGHVIQTFTEKGKFTGQKFIVGHLIKFEDEKGKPRSIGTDKNDAMLSKVYHPFDMMQFLTMGMLVKSYFRK